jgi:hypothetical protein
MIKKEKQYAIKRADIGSFPQSHLTQSLEKHKEMIITYPRQQENRDFSGKRQEAKIVLLLRRNVKAANLTLTSVLTVRPFVRDGGDGVVPACILQGVLCHRTITGWRCKR